MSDPTNISRVYRIDDKPFAEEQDADDAALTALQPKLPLSTLNTKVGAVIDLVPIGAGLNLSANWQALELVRIDTDSLLSLHLKEVAATGASASVDRVGWASRLPSRRRRDTRLASRCTRLAGEMPAPPKGQMRLP